MSSELNITNGMSGEDPGRNEANLSSAKGRQVGPASWPVVDRTGGLSHRECGTKPICEGKCRWGNGLGVDETKPISGESRRRQQGEWDAGFCETKPISYLGVWVGAGSGAWRARRAQICGRWG